MKKGDLIPNPELMSIESINKEKQSAVVVWIDEKSGLTCRCEIPLEALEKVMIN